MRRVREFMIQHGVSGLTAAVQVAAAVTLMVVYSPVLGLVFLVTAPLYVLMMRFSSRTLRPIFDNLEAGFGRHHAYQIDAIKGIATDLAVASEAGLREDML